MLPRHVVIFELRLKCRIDSYPIKPGEGLKILPRIFRRETFICAISDASEFSSNAVSLFVWWFSAISRTRAFNISISPPLMINFFVCRVDYLDSLSCPPPPHFTNRFLFIFLINATLIKPANLKGKRCVYSSIRRFIYFEEISPVLSTILKMTW